MSLLEFKYKHTHTNTQGFIVVALVSGTLDCLGSWFPADRLKSSNIFGYLQDRSFSCLKSLKVSKLTEICTRANWTKSLCQYLPETW